MTFPLAPAPTLDTPPGQTGWQGVAPARFALVLAIGLILWALPRPAEVDPRAWRLCAVFVATVAGIIAKPLPMGAVALTGIAAALLIGALTLAEALGGFGNNVVWLVVGAFFIATGFIKTGLGPRIAYGFVAFFGRSTLGLSYSLIATDLALAPAVPTNTGRAAGVVFPILQSLARTALRVDEAAGRQTMAFLTLTTYQGTVVTSAMFMTAMAANPLVTELAMKQGIAITWSLWARAAIVPGLVSLAVVPLVIYRMSPPGVRTMPAAPMIARAELGHLGPMKRNEWLMALVVTGLLLAWMLGPVIGIDSTAAALVAVSALLVTGVLQWEDICREHEAWNTFIWFATLVMMATVLGQLGLIKWFSGRVGSTFSGIGWLPGLIGLSLTYFYSHYLFASNTAHVSAMYAPFLAVALTLGAPPMLAALVLAFFSSLFAALTHYGTAPAPILYGSGHVPLATWWKVGAVLSVIHILIWLGLGPFWWRLLGLW